MEETFDDILNQIKIAEDQKKMDDYYRDLALRKQHKKVKQLLRGSGTYNKKRLRERTELLNIMKGYAELKNNEQV